MFNLLRSLWGMLEKKRRLQFKLLVLLMIVASLAEILSLGSLLPFLGVIASPEQIYHNPNFKPIISFLQLSGPLELLIPFASIFIVLTFLSGCIRLFMMWANIRYSYAIGADLSAKLFYQALHQPYKTHCERNSSEVVDIVTNKTNLVIHTIGNCLNLVSSAIILLSLIFALIIFNPLITAFSFFGFALIYFGIIKLYREQQLKNSEVMATNSPKVIKILQEGIGGIRDILINGSQEIYYKKFKITDCNLRLSQGASSFIGSSPRYVVEAFGMILIASLASYLAIGEDNFNVVLPILGVFALAAQRMLPLFQLIYASWSGISFGRFAIQDVLNFLHQPFYLSQGRENLIHIPFKYSIELKSVSFKYCQKSDFILRDVDLRILKGERVGFIGATGGGKSTLLDILMGLLEPTTGTIKIDGMELTSLNRRAWQAHVAHVPQNIYLSDATVEENIAFGEESENIDHARLLLAARRAQIDKTIESWPLRYKTMIGENGVRLSGGQRQRIGIARALYKKSTSILIFDEATSALDINTERSVISAIEELSPNITLLMIAHRLETLSNCTKIIKIKDQKISII